MTATREERLKAARDAEYNARRRVIYATDRYGVGSMAWEEAVNEHHFADQKLRAIEAEAKP